MIRVGLLIMPIDISQKDKRTIWRSPLIWVVMAIISFIAAWLFWQMLDRYIALQNNLVNLPNPPNITGALWTPFFLTVSKLLTLLVAFTTAIAVTQEKSQNTLWYLLINQQSIFSVVLAKLKAQLPNLIFTLLILMIAALLLHVGGQLNLLLVLFSFLGMVLYLIWLTALGMFVSSMIDSTGAAVLLNLLVFGVFWFLGGEQVAQGFGVNWIHLFSPAHHLRWFAQGELSLSSLVFFVFGTFLFLWLLTLNLQNTKNS